MNMFQSKKALRWLSRFFFLCLLGVKAQAATVVTPNNTCNTNDLCNVIVVADPNSMDPDTMMAPTGSVVNLPVPVAVDPDATPDPVTAPLIPKPQPLTSVPVSTPSPTALLKFEETNNATATPASNPDFSTLPPAAPLKSEVVPGEVLLKLKEKPDKSFSAATTGNTQLDGLMQQFKVQSVEKLAVVDAFAQSSTRAQWGQEVDKLRKLLIPKVMDPVQVANAFSKAETVAFAEPNWTVSIFGTPNDPHFNQQWALKNIGQNNGIPGADISAPEAWDISLGGNTVLAIIDTGLDTSHEEFSNKLLLGIDLFFDDSDPSDDNGHGSLVAGIAAGKINNALGIAGVCQDCRIMPIKAFDNSGYSSWAIIAESITYAVDHGAQVINLSLGGSECSAVIETAINYANKAGVSVVAATGNQGSLEPPSPISCPANLAETLAVGASNNQDQRWFNSTYGPEIDLVAPGEDILSTFFDQGYVAFSGVSAAVPLVTGAIGVIQSFCQAEYHKLLTPDQVRTLLKETADDLGSPGWDEEHGAGRLNLAAALALAQQNGCYSDTLSLTCPKTPTIESIGSGGWNEPSTWDLNRRPRRYDVVLVKPGHHVVLPATWRVMNGVCNYGELSSLPDQSLKLTSATPDGFFHNYGKITGKRGSDGTSSQCPNPGSGITIIIKDGPIYNHAQGIILSGDGGDSTNSSCVAGKGGSVTLLANGATNDGSIGSGQGGNAKISLVGSRGGRGGHIRIKGDYKALGTLIHNGLIHSGDGGQGYYGGRGGNVTLKSLPNVQLNGQVFSGIGGDIAGRLGRIFIDPEGILISNKAEISGGEIIISCGGQCEALNLRDLLEGTLSAQEAITLAVASGGTLDLTGSAANALQSAGVVNILADDLKTDEGVVLTDLVAAEAGITQGVGQIIREVALIAPSVLSGDPGAQLFIDFMLLNEGPEGDTYRLHVEQSAYWQLGALPTVVSVTAGGTLDEADGLLLPVTLASTPGAQNYITISAVSMTDNTVKDAVEVQVNVIAPPVESPVRIFGSIPISTQPGDHLPPCPSTGYIDWMCNNHGQVITDAVLGPAANVVGGILAGSIKSEGIVSQVAIARGAILEGGKITGFVTSQGILSNFEFVGADLSGGTISGDITNKSPVQGTLTDVCLVANTHIKGGFMQGVITSEAEAVALEKVVIRKVNTLSEAIQLDNVTKGYLAATVEVIAPVAQCTLQEKEDGMFEDVAAAQ